MKCRLVKLSKFSGNKASIYSVILNNENHTLFDKFLKENISLYKSEIEDIFKTLTAIGSTTGARESFFKWKEGQPGDGVVALYDASGKKLRLYCIHYGTQLIVVGNGGPKNVRAFQEDEKLKKENYFLRWLSKQITDSIKEGEITYENGGLDFAGNLKFKNDEEE